MKSFGSIAVIFAIGDGFAFVLAVCVTVSGPDPSGFHTLVFFGSSAAKGPVLVCLSTTFAVIATSADLLPFAMVTFVFFAACTTCFPVCGYGCTVFAAGVAMADDLPSSTATTHAFVLVADDLSIAIDAGQSTRV
jgi:hypothetical protein